MTHVYRHALGVRGVADRAAADSLAADPRVAAVLPDREVRITAQTVPAGIDRVGADESSAVAGDGRGAVDVDIAILDTGIDAKHRDLNVVGGVNCIQGNNSYLDLNGHGTHVAGTAAAKDNNVGVVGVAPGARLWAVRVLDAGGSGSWSSIICGIDWVTAHADTIEVANMSLGGSGGKGRAPITVCTRPSAARPRQESRTWSPRATPRSAAGFVPATYDEVITVSAITDFDGQPGGVGAPTCQIGFDDTFANFSNYGPDVDLTAPGVCVHVDLARRRLPVDLRHLDGQPPRRRRRGALPLHPPRRHPGTGARRTARSRHPDWAGDPDSTQEPLLTSAALTTRSPHSQSVAHA